MELENSISSPTQPRIEFLELFTGWDEAERDIWCYIAIRRELYLDFKKSIADGVNIKLEDYGRILRQGMGMIPPPGVCREMSEQYGFDHAFEAKLAKSINNWMGD